MGPLKIRAAKWVLRTSAVDSGENKRTATAATINIARDRVRVLLDEKMCEGSPILEANPPQNAGFPSTAMKGELEIGQTNGSRPPHSAGCGDGELAL